MTTLDKLKKALSAHCRPFGCDDCEYEKKSFCRDLLIKDVAEYIQSVNLLEWIPVTERLPDHYTDVIVFSRQGDSTAVGLAYRMRNRWYCPYDVYVGEYVTHWMPLPEPPKEEVNHA